MIKSYIICLILLLPNITFADLRCSPAPLAEYLMYGGEDGPTIVSFKVIKGYPFPGHVQTLEVEIIKAFFPKKIENTHMQIGTASISDDPKISMFKKDTEWLAVIWGSDDFNEMAGCGSTLAIKNGNIKGNTGIEILNETNEPVSVQMFELALNAFQQGISLADQVCKSSNSYCTERATYDIDTGILSLPSVEYEFGVIPGAEIRHHTKVKLKKVGEGIKTFVITEIE